MTRHLFPPVRSTRSREVSRSGEPPGYWLPRILGRLPHHPFPRFPSTPRSRPPGLLKNYHCLGYSSLKENTPPRKKKLYVKSTCVLSSTQWCSSKHMRCGREVIPMGVPRGSNRSIDLSSSSWKYLFDSMCILKYLSGDVDPFTPVF